MLKRGKQYREWGRRDGVASESHLFSAVPALSEHSASQDYRIFQD